MLYAELVAKRKVAAVVVEILKNAYFLSYMLAKNIVAVQNLPKERNHFVPLKLQLRHLLPLILDAQISMYYLFNYPLIEWVFPEVCI